MFVAPKVKKTSLYTYDTRGSKGYQKNICQNVAAGGDVDANREWHALCADRPKLKASRVFNRYALK